MTLKRASVNYFWTIVSVALVLFVTGFFLLLVFQGRQLVNIFKERVDIWLELQHDTPPNEVSALVAALESKPFIVKKSILFITREQAAEAMKNELGHESMLPDLPDIMRDAIKFNVMANYMTTDSLAAFREELKQQAFVSDLYYEPGTGSNATKNIEKISLIALGLGILLIFAAIMLIHNTVRLALYSNRFLIKNMELVGATHGFISKPYIVRGILNGLWSALLAIIALIGFFYFLQQQLPELAQLEDPVVMILVYGLLTILGVCISGLSAWWVVKKYLGSSIENLY